jgi:hypothetical protein
MTYQLTAPMAISSRLQRGVRGRFLGAARADRDRTGYGTKFLLPAI